MEQLQTAFEKYVSLTTSMIAVALSISAIFSNSVGDALLLSRSAANNEWSYFQSKSIKKHLFETQYKMLELSLKNSQLDTIYRLEIRKQLKDFRQEIDRYEVDKEQIENNAKKYEAICAKADQQGGILDLAEAFYQISIILSAIAMIAHSRLLWYVSMGLGTVGICLTSYVYFFI